MSCRHVSTHVSLMDPDDGGSWLSPPRTATRSSWCCELLESSQMRLSKDDERGPNMTLWPTLSSDGPSSLLSHVECSGCDHGLCDMTQLKHPNHVNDALFSPIKTTLCNSPSRLLCSSAAASISKHFIKASDLSQPSSATSTVGQFIN